MKKIKKMNKRWTLPNTNDHYAAALGKVQTINQIFQKKADLAFSANYARSVFFHVGHPSVW
jgi:hypothetical protein